MMASFLILFLLGLTGGVYSETCPSYEDLYPCKCEKSGFFESIVVRCISHMSSLKDIKEAMNLLSGKKDVEIELENIHLGDVPSDIFTGVDIRSLYINSCELHSLKSDNSKPALSGLEDTLEELSIYISTPVTVIEILELGHLHRLKKVDLYYNTIPELGNDWFEGGPSSLKLLHMNYCGIKKLGDQAFADLDNLVDLCLENNRFKEVKRSMFPSSAQGLSSIRLDGNALESLPEDIFTDMPSLDQISLKENRIKRLEKNTWEPIWEQLNSLDIDENPLHCDSHMDWMFDLREIHIFGTCETPEDQHEKDLYDFITKRGE